MANLALLPLSEAEGPLLQAMSSDSSLEKYWGCIAAASAGFDSPQLLEAAKTLLDDSHLLVRVRAAEYLAITSDFDPRDAILRVLRESESAAEVLLTLNTVVFLRDFGPKVDFELERSSIRSINPEVERRLKYLAE